MADDIFFEMPLGSFQSLLHHVRLQILVTSISSGLSSGLYEALLHKSSKSR
ncbi:MAG: hypothetical protein E5299_01623 [Burkholderia gladioli]|nr:MAG: hypothetical protein E5299_01623 [Burkholderia gladioli]